MNTKQEMAEVAVYVSGPADRESYWQPMPANGYIDVALAPHIVGMKYPFGMGTQNVAPGGYVREHTHEENEEAIFVIDGKGRAVIEGKVYPLEPNAVVFLPMGTRHMFINDGDTDLRWVWLIVPNGLEDFFRLIGRPRSTDQNVPVNFPRPTDVHIIEQATVFGKPLEDPIHPEDL